MLPEGRAVKTDQSKREIPLVGVVLMAMRVQPDGFPRYRDKAEVLSALEPFRFSWKHIRRCGSSWRIRFDRWR